MTGTRRGANPLGPIARLAVLAVVLVVPLSLFLYSDGSGTMGNASSKGPDDGDYRGEVASYLWGGALAFVLTAIPFALVHWSVLSTSWLLVTIAIFAFVQIVVHFRFFLHIDPPNQNTDDLLLILFTTLIIVAMAGGTIWILGDLATRMH